MPKADPSEQKAATLREHHALNPRPHEVSDPAFTTDDPFFDPRDLVQVKYEMLRSVQRDGRPASRAAGAFGFSRPSFYHTQTVFAADGLPGLLPKRPGPRRAHKLSEQAIDVLERALADDPALNSSALAKHLESKTGIKVHARSVERSLERRRRKKGLHKQA
jgi:transposase